MPRSSSNLSELNEQLNQQQTSNEEDNDMYDFPTTNSQSIKQQQIKVNLNKGKRIDYMLQEKPIEFFNQYIFALATHACYWSNEDTILFVLKELYKLKQIYTVKDLGESELNLNQFNQEMPNSSSATSNSKTNIQNNYNIQTHESNYQSTSVNVE